MLYQTTNSLFNVIALGIKDSTFTFSHVAVLNQDRQAAFVLAVPFCVCLD